jgi:hypothetical protein
MSVGSLVKTLETPKKSKGKENVLESIVESSEHIDFHWSSESNGDVHSLIIPLNGLMTRKASK